MVYWHWKASIISHLSIVKPSLAFTSLEELLESSYQIATVKDSSYAAYWFESEDGSIEKRIADTKFVDESSSLKATEQDVIDQTQVGLYAMYTTAWGKIMSLKLFFFFLIFFRRNTVG